MTAGAPRSEAERCARMEFGSIDGAKDDCRQARGVSFIDALRQDFRYALRVLRRSPGFALLCIGIMAVGIGANTAVFTVVNAVLLKPLPYREPRRIVTLSNVVKTPALNALAKLISVPDFQDWHDQSTVFDAMAYYGTPRVSVTVGTSAEYARLTRVTREFFRVFDVQPVAGRPFTADEEKVGAGAVLISSVYARRHFAEPSRALGQVLRVFDRPMTVASGDPGLLAETMREKAHERSPDVSVKATTMDVLVGEHFAAPRFRTVLVALFGAVALCLALAGIYGVMAYTVAQRSREIGLRMALGATAQNILWMMLRRGVQIVAAGLLIGLVGAAAMTRLLTTFLFEIRPHDGITYASVVALLGVMSTLAIYLPARRSSKVEPLIALRAD